MEEEGGWWIDSSVASTVELMLMLMPVSAGPAESQTCSRAIVVIAPDSHTPNTRPNTMPVFQLRHAFR